MSVHNIRHVWDESACSMAHQAGSGKDFHVNGVLATNNFKAMFLFEIVNKVCGFALTINAF